MSEDFEDMEAPVICDGCGKWFDLFDGNGCKVCHVVYCPDCLGEPFDICKKCKE